MGHRLSKIYTRTGDAGETGLADGSRVPKDAPRIHALGEVDELNSHIGALLCHSLPPQAQAALTEIQHRLFDLGGELAVPGTTVITAGDAGDIESVLDALNAPLPRLAEFILPGGGAAACSAHLARAVCRRAERALVTLAREEQVSECSRRYLNRLSDLLFVLARILARNADGEVCWQPRRAPD